MTLYYRNIAVSSDYSCAHDISRMAGLRGGCLQSYLSHGKIYTKVCASCNNKRTLQWISQSQMIIEQCFNILNTLPGANDPSVVSECIDIGKRCFIT